MEYGKLQRYRKFAYVNHFTGVLVTAPRQLVYGQRCSSWLNRLVLGRNAAIDVCFNGKQCGNLTSSAVTWSVQLSSWSLTDVKQFNNRQAVQPAGAREQCNQPVRHCRDRHAAKIAAVRMILREMIVPRAWLWCCCGGVCAAFMQIVEIRLLQSSNLLIERIRTKLTVRNRRLMTRQDNNILHSVLIFPTVYALAVDCVKK